MMIPEYAFRQSRQRSKSKEDLMGLVQEKLHELSYFPIYITPDLEERIRNLQATELRLRQSKRFTLDKGVEILKEIDDINTDLDKLAKEYRIEMAEKASRYEIEEAVEARKRKSTRSKSKRKVIKKTVKRKTKR